MTIWKNVTLLSILAIAGACANSPESDNKPADKATDKGKTETPKAITVPTGTSLSVVLSTALNSGKNKAGDTFTGNLSEPVVVDGKTVLEKGTKVEGKVVSAEGAGKVKGVGKMSLALTGATAGGKTVAITTKSHSAAAEETKGRDAAVIAGGAGVGAAVGAIAGGKKGAAVGAAVGGGGGTGVVLATKGKDVDYPAESRIEFTLDQDVTLTP